LVTGNNRCILIYGIAVHSALLLEGYSEEPVGWDLKGGQGITSMFVIGVIIKAIASIVLVYR